MQEDVMWSSGKTMRKLNGNSDLISDHTTYMVMQQQA